jgi:LPXTG-site transpeptidase (sortase) family protein
MRGSRPAAAIALGAGLLVAGAGAVGLLTRQSAVVARPVALASVSAPAGPIAGPPLASRPVHAARPVALIIPAIGVRTGLIRLKLTKGGALEVPASTSVAGWYTGSSPPGALGPAVIVGHVDSRTGPGIFFRLNKLRAGDRIYVRRADGTIVAFRVTSVQVYRKDQFPTVAVYGPAPDAELRLITCGGVFDRSLRSYLSNIVVYATLET